jgi:hypothetical protein
VSSLLAAPYVQRGHSPAAVSSSAAARQHRGGLCQVAPSRAARAVSSRAMPEVWSRAARAVPSRCPAARPVPDRAGPNPCRPEPASAV